MNNGNEPSRTVLITGAFSYTGKYATRLLLQRGYQVRTLTAHGHHHNEFGRAVEVFPFNFANPSDLERSLEGASTLVNTYWIRFGRSSSTFESAIKNTITLFNAAKKAGVRRIVHVSIANPSADSSLGYYRGKALLESALEGLQVPYSIIRPTVIFGREDILINNIAWFLRNFPVFAIPGDGQYRVRPVYVEDLAVLLVDAVEQQANEVTNAVGPETFRFEDLVRSIAESLGRSPMVVHIPMLMAYLATRLSGWFVGDVILTRQEYQGLMSGRLAVDGPATGNTRFNDWLKAHRHELGATYRSEIARHFRAVA